jgi:hypothetical protein
MPAIAVLDTGRIDERESAFPQAVQLPGGDILCSYSVGGGQYVHGGTDWSRSTDGGRTWRAEGRLLPPSDDPPSTNCLRLSAAPDGRVVYAYGARFLGKPGTRFGERRNEAVLCRSTDGGRSWSPPETVPMPDCALEISHSILPLGSGRLLAPAALLADEKRLGEEVIAAVSDDGGRSWPARTTIFRDPEGKLGFWEQKLADLGGGRVIAVAWTVTLGDYRDCPDSFVLSSDGGSTWGPPRTTGIRGQTMTPVPLGGDRLLVLYNRRYGAQGVVACAVTCTETAWTLAAEEVIFDARTVRAAPGAGTGVDELANLKFGFPTAIRLQDGTFLATHWSVEGGVCGIRWTKLRVDA